MQLYHRLITPVTSSSKSSYQWCEIEFNDNQPTIKVAEADLNGLMPLDTQFIAQPIDEQQPFILPVINPTIGDQNPEDATFCIVIHQNQCYKFVYEEPIGYTIVYQWDSLANNWRKIPLQDHLHFPLTTTIHTELTALVATQARAQFHQQYLLWQLTETFLQQLKVDSDSNETFCLSLIYVMNRKLGIPLSELLNEKQREIIQQFSFDYLHAPNIEYLAIDDPDLRVAAYHDMMERIFNTFIQYRINITEPNIVNFKRDDIEKCHYKTKLQALHASGLWPDINPIEPKHQTSLPPDALEIRAILLFIQNHPEQTTKQLNTLLSKLDHLQILIYDPFFDDFPALKKVVLKHIAASSWINGKERLFSFLELLSTQEFDDVLPRLPHKKQTWLSTEPAKLAEFLTRSPNNYHLLYLELERMMQHLIDPAVKKQTKTLLNCIAQLYRQEPQNQQLAEILRLTCNLLNSTPGIERQKLTQAYQQHALCQQGKPSRLWQAAGITMTLLGIAIAALGYCQLLTTAGTFVGCAIALSGMGLFAYASQQTALSQNIQAMSKTVSESSQCQTRCFV